MPPVIAIVGRPNVGKSTLFNRLSEKKKAIVIDEPGATRDRNYANCEWYGHPFALIDTGGFEPAAEHGILNQMREQTMLAIEEADAIIFLMDSREGLTHNDQEIAQLLRETCKPVFYVVNKIDAPSQDDALYDFYALGVEKLYPISSQQGPGIYELMEDLSGSIPMSSGTTSVDGDEIRIAILGRPNVGKSSLVNCILGYDRTITNATPGTTRDAIDTLFTFNGRKYVLIDTAGIRRKGRISLTLEKFSVIQAIKTIHRCDIALILIDAQEKMTEQDIKIAGLAFERGTACIFVVNKWDTIEKDTYTTGIYIRNIRDKAKFLDFAPVEFVSALTGQRVKKIFGTVEDVYEQFTQRISTGELNRAARMIIDKNPPPLYRNRPNTISYMTQAAIKPPTFVFFVREPKAIHFSYERYLTNQVRKMFHFNKVPVRILFREK
jgi:GTP-binding protein